MTRRKPSLTDYIIADLHLGHKSARVLPGRIMYGFNSVEEHDSYVIAKICNLPPESRLWILGDVAFNMAGLSRLGEIPKEKGYRLHLIKGNHDGLSDNTYLKYFHSVGAMAELNTTEKDDGYKRVILTHVPIHPYCLSRWDYNIHGHLHETRLNGRGYINVSCEQIDFEPVKIIDTLRWYGELFN